MKTFITALIFSLFCVTAQASETMTIDTSGMTAEQVALIKKQIDETKSASQKAVEHVEKAANMVAGVDFSKWESAADNAASAIIAFTSKMGLAAKDFLTSPTGFLIAIAGALYFFGGNIATLIFTIFLSYYGARFVHRMFSEKHDVLVSEKVDKDGNVNKKYKEKYILRFSLWNKNEYNNNIADGDVFMYFLAMIIVQAPVMLYFFL